MVLPYFTSHCSERLYLSKSVQQLKDDKANVVGDGGFAFTSKIIIKKGKLEGNLIEIEDELNDERTTIALKVIEKNQDNYEEKELEKEYHLQSILAADKYERHTPDLYFCGKLYDQGTEYYVIGMELGEKDLFTKLIDEDQCSSLTYRQKFDLMYQMANTIYDAHSANMCHCDLKLENFLVTNNDTIKLIDFGWATYDGDNCIGGTKATISPEVAVKFDMFYETDVWRFKPDIYSLGIIFAEVMLDCLVNTGGFNKQILFNNNTGYKDIQEFIDIAIEEYMPEKEFLNENPIVHQEKVHMRVYLLKRFKKLILSMVEINFTKRPGIYEVVTKLRIFRTVTSEILSNDQVSYIKMIERFTELSKLFGMDFGENKPQKLKEVLPAVEDESAVLNKQILNKGIENHRRKTPNKSIFL